jgi:hypothetical protein
MSSSNLIRLSGLAAVAAGVLLLIGDLLAFATEPENLSEWATAPSYVFVWLLFLLGAVLLLVGLVGLYVRQSEAAGVLGFVGFLIAFLGTALALGTVWAQLFVAPSLATEAPGVLDNEPTGMLAAGFMITFMIVFPLGWLLFGIATLRAQVYPRAPAIVLIAGSVITFLPLPLTGLVLDVAVAWLGLTLMSGQVAAQATAGAQPRVQ